ncbi:MAG: class I SAM-dependent methyltransferase [Planctomycetales bacterium]|nr:class I SAM-dependent methyltransferase [Planctomycetales bacterium]
MASGQFGSNPDDAPRAIRHEYEAVGPAQFYAEQGGAYRNPHEDRVAAALEYCVKQWPLDLTCVLDLACGSGEATLALRALGAADVVGIDPFTHEAYAARTGQAARPLTFEAIAAGALSGERFSLIVCSYALHLLAPSRLPQLMLALSQVAPSLLILSPHKRPVVRDDWGWRLDGEIYRQRVRARWWTSREPLAGADD